MGIINGRQKEYPKTHSLENIIVRYQLMDIDRENVIQIRNITSKSLSNILKNAFSYLLAIYIIIILIGDNIIISICLCIFLIFDKLMKKNKMQKKDKKIVLTLEILFLIFFTFSDLANAEKILLCFYFHKKTLSFGSVKELFSIQKIIFFILHFFFVKLLIEIEFINTKELLQLSLIISSFISISAIITLFIQKMNLLIINFKKSLRFLNDSFNKSKGQIIITNEKAKILLANSGAHEIFQKFHENTLKNYEELSLKLKQEFGNKLIFLSNYYNRKKMMLHLNESSKDLFSTYKSESNLKLKSKTFKTIAFNQPIFYWHFQNTYLKRPILFERMNYKNVVKCINYSIFELKLESLYSKKNHQEIIPPIIMRRIIYSLNPYCFPQSKKTDKDRGKTLYCFNISDYFFKFFDSFYKEHKKLKIDIEFQNRLDENSLIITCFEILDEIMVSTMDLIIEVLGSNQIVFILELYDNLPNTYILLLKFKVNPKNKTNAQFLKDNINIFESKKKIFKKLALPLSNFYLKKYLVNKLFYQKIVNVIYKVRSNNQFMINIYYPVVKMHHYQRSNLTKMFNHFYSLIVIFSIYSIFIVDGLQYMDFKKLIIFS